MQRVLPQNSGGWSVWVVSLPVQWYSVNGIYTPQTILQLIRYSTFLEGWHHHSSSGLGYIFTLLRSSLCEDPIQCSLKWVGNFPIRNMISPLRLPWGALAILMQSVIVPEVWAPHLLMMPHGEDACSSQWIGSITRLQWSQVGLQKWWFLIPKGMSWWGLISPSGRHIWIKRWYGFLWSLYWDWEVDRNWTDFALWDFLLPFLIFPWIFVSL